LSKPAAATATWPPASRSLAVALCITAVVTVVSHLAPREWANTAVGAVFLAAAWWLVLRRDTVLVRASGVAFGGLTELEPLDRRRLFGEAARALGWALAVAAVVFPPFVLGYLWWWRPVRAFQLGLPEGAVDLVLGQLLVIALPEEVFFRGFLQSALDDRWSSRRWRLLGAELGPGWLCASALFAVGHVLTIVHPARLAVFFPALLFGWLRARTGGVGASVVLHAACNVLTSLLAHGYGLE
jgi:membrane protease YdiL (CAAX protease family)